MAKQLTDQEIVAIINQEVAQATGNNGSELQAQNEEAIKYYLGKPLGNEVAGRSSIISMDVADNVNSVLSQLTPMIKSVLVEFEPDSEEDTDAAQLESDMVNWVAGQSDAYAQLAGASFDALLQGNGWIKVYVDEENQSWTTKHTGLNDVTIIEATQPKDPGEQVEITSQSEDEDTGLFDITVKHTIDDKFLRIESVAPEYMLYSSYHQSTNIKGIRFIAEIKLISKSDLIEMGYPRKKVMELPTTTWTPTQTVDARQPEGVRAGGDQDATRVVTVYEAYLELDRNQDGSATLHRCMMAGASAGVLLSVEEARFIPYATGSAIPMPHRVAGTSQFTMLKPIQDSKTHILRQWLDNHNNANNTRLGAVEGSVNLADLQSTRPGGIIRMRSPDGIVNIPFNDVGPSCQAALNYLDQVRTERGGASLELGTGQMQVAQSSATGAANEYASKEKMTTWYCRNIVESIVRDSFLLIHQALRYFYDADISARLHGKWQSTNPQEWKQRRNVLVVGGLSTSERAQRSQALTQNLQMQQMAMQAGMDGTLVTPEKIHNTVTDWLRSVDLGEVEEYYVDPASEEAQQAGQAKQQQAQEAGQKEEQMMTALTELPLTLDKYKHDSQLQFDRWEAQLKAEIEEMKVVGKATGDMAVQAQKNLAEVAEEVAE